MRNITIAILISVFWINISIVWTGPTTLVNNSVAEAQNSIRRKVDAKSYFRFYLPPSMRDTGFGGMENFRRDCGFR